MVKEQKRKRLFIDVQTSGPKTCDKGNTTRLEKRKAPEEEGRLRAQRPVATPS